MALIKGRTKMNDLFRAIVSDLKGLMDSPWIPHFEDTANFVLKSQGSSSTDVLFIRLGAGNSTAQKGNYLQLWVSDGIDSNTGVALSSAKMHGKNILVHSAVVDSNLLINYEISIQPDRIIFWLSGDINSATGLSTMAYAGLMKRYALESDSSANCIGVSYSGDNGVRTIKDKAGNITNTPTGTVSNIYDAFATVLPSNPGWGDLYHVSPVVMANNTEGARGELYDIYAIASAGVSHGDEVTINTKVHKIYKLSAGGNTFLPSTTVAVQMD